MNRHLIVPLLLADALAALALAIGLCALFAPEVPLFAPIAAHGLALPLAILGGLGMLGCGALMLRWFLFSMRERSR